MMRQRRIALCVILAACLAAGAWSAHARILPWAARWLDVGQTPRKSDYVLALGGDPGVRPFVTLAILQAGFAKQILVSQVLPLPEGLFPPDHELCVRAYRAAGVLSKQMIPLGRANQATYDEARALAEFLASRPDARVLVVTSAFHTRRARWIFRQVLGARAASVCWVATPSELYQAENWWRTREGLAFVPAENLRFLYYLWRYSAAVRVAVVAGCAAALTLGLWLCFRRKVRPGASPTAASRRRPAPH